MRSRARRKTAGRSMAAGMAACLAGAALVGAGAAQAATPPRPLLGGWFGYWATDSDIRAMTTDADGVVSEVSMFWWSFQGEKQPLCTFNNDGGPTCARGSATPWTTSRFETMLRDLHKAGIKVQGSITDVYSGTAGQLSRYLATDKRRQAYATHITDWATKAGVDGVDLDWENFAFNDGRDSWDATKERWIAFLKVLYPKLHAAGLTLSATVPGGVYVNDVDTGYWVYAWEDIIDYVDRLQIMAYDYSWDNPGPIGPNSWARSVVARAVNDVGAANSAKVWIGQPQYGRDWPVQGANGWASDANCPEGWQPSATPDWDLVTPTSAAELARVEKVTPTWDETSGEWTFVYGAKTAGTYMKKVKGEKKPVKTPRECAVKHEVWYGGTKSAIARASIVNEYKIGGIVVWDFSTVAEGFYSELANFGRGVAPAETVVKVDAPEVIVHGDFAKVKVKASAKSKPAAGSLATLYWRSSAAGAKRVMIDSAKLSKDGTHVFAATAERNGEWVVGVEGSFTRRAGQSVPVETRVQFAVEASADTVTPKAGTVVPMTATLAPAVADINVVLQRQGPGGWTTLRTLTTDDSGVVKAEVRPTVVKSTNYRFVAKRSDANAWGMSQVITFRVQARYLPAATL